MVDKKHEEHLAVVAPEVVKRKLAGFRLEKVNLEALPFRCKSFSVRPDRFIEYQKWLHPLDPVSLEDMKNWFGVPNELAKQRLQDTHRVRGDTLMRSRATQIAPTTQLPSGNWDFKKLDNAQRIAVHQTSRNLLYGYVPPERQKEPATAKVIDYMLSAAKRLKMQIFAAPDLVICPNEVVDFHGVPVLYFNNILIYGNGQLRTRNTTSIHALQIKRIP